MFLVHLIQWSRWKGGSTSDIRMDVESSGGGGADQCVSRCVGRDRSCSRGPGSCRCGSVEEIRDEGWERKWSSSEEGQDNGRRVVLGSSDCSSEHERGETS